jgi:ectoine hydroxylase-related dioxygenase (phytanoyl-CoA dioxygenase family)
MQQHTQQHTQQRIDEIHEQGYTVLENVLDSSQVLDIKQALAPWLQQSLFGRNNFEGHQTERVYALLAKDPAFAQLVTHPRVLAIVDAFLAPTYLLSANLAINVHPGETPQPIHADHTAVRNAARNETHGISTIWAFDDFTSSNGATEVIPGSHRWPEALTRDPDELASQARQVLLRAGSVLVFHGSLLHRGGANRAQTTRLAITPQYCQPWLRQLENMALAVPAEVARQYPTRVQELLGYSICEPGFMGYVDGMHPKRLLDEHYQGRHYQGRHYLGRQARQQD